MERFIFLVIGIILGGAAGVYIGRWSK